MKFWQIKIWILLIMLFLNNSCERKTNWPLNFTSQSYIIVDGIITNENISHRIYLSYSNSEMNSSLNPVSGAYMVIFDGQDSIRFFEDPLIPGNYESESSFIAVINKKYKLEMKISGNNYYAISGMLPVSPSSILSYTQSSDSNFYVINSAVAIFNPNEAAMYEITIDWSDLPGYEELPADSTMAIQYFYSLTTLDVNQIFAPIHEKVLFPKGSTIIEKKFSLTPDHEKYIRSILIETQWNGGNFDVAEGNVYTNLSSGALGFFGVCSVVSDTLIAY